MLLLGDDWIGFCRASLCSCGSRAEMATYLRYVRRLDFFETPYYNYLRKLFLDVVEQNQWEIDWNFDWVARQQVRTPLESTPIDSTCCNIFCNSSCVQRVR